MLNFPVGFIFEDDEGGLILVDRNSVFLPDSLVRTVKELGISDDEYQENIVQKQKEIDQLIENRKVKTDSKGFIYAVKIGNKIKMGRTSRLESRFMAYKNVSDEFTILATAEVSEYKKAEKEMLVKFGWQRGDNEYFPHSDNLEAKVIEHINGLNEVTV